MSQITSKKRISSIFFPSKCHPFRIARKFIYRHYNENFVAWTGGCLRAHSRRISAGCRLLLRTLNITRIFRNFTWKIFSHVKGLDQSLASCYSPYNYVTTAIIILKDIEFTRCNKVTSCLVVVLNYAANLNRNTRNQLNLRYGEIDLDRTVKNLCRSIFVTILSFFAVIFSKESFSVTEVNFPKPIKPGTS